MRDINGFGLTSSWPPLHARGQGSVQDKALWCCVISGCCLQGLQVGTYSKQKMHRIYRWMDGWIRDAVVYFETWTYYKYFVVTHLAGGWGKWVIGQQMENLLFVCPEWKLTFECNVKHIFQMQVSIRFQGKDLPKYTCIQVLFQIIYTPWPSSVWAYVPMTCMVTAGGSHLVCCSGVPSLSMAGMNITACTAMARS